MPLWLGEKRAAMESGDGDPVHTVRWENKVSLSLWQSLWPNGWLIRKLGGDTTEAFGSDAEGYRRCYGGAVGREITRT